MGRCLSGKEVREGLLARVRVRADALARRPRLAIVRVGEKKSDLAYEKGVKGNADKAGVEAVTFAFPQEIDTDTLTEEVAKIGQDDAIDGILLFLPLPAEINAAKVIAAIPPEKDVDGAGAASRLSVYTGEGPGFAPCTPQAVMEIIDHYGIDPQGMRAVIVGRSQVVGKPLAMLLLARGATVTVCHTKTRDLAAETARAELLVTAAGHLHTVTKAHVRPEQILIDVGINFDEDGKLAGDADRDCADIVGAYTPVPGGVGAVTTAVLLLHTLEAAEKKADACRQ